MIFIGERRFHENENYALIRFYSFKITGYQIKNNYIKYLTKK